MKFLIQVKGEFQAKDDSIARYLQEVQHRSKGFDAFEIKHIPWVKNEKVKLLSKLACTKRLRNNHTIIQETLDELSINRNKVINIEEDPASWKSPILKYLQIGHLPKTLKVAVKLRNQ